MRARNVELTDELDRFVASMVERGQYADAGEVVRSALRLLQREEREHEQKMAVLRAAITEGDASGDADEGVFERLYTYIDDLAVKKAKNAA
jgi:antitoxin ParD1/3/4